MYSAARKGSPPNRLAVIFRLAVNGASRASLHERDMGNCKRLKGRGDFPTRPPFAAIRVSLQCSSREFRR